MSSEVFEVFNEFTPLVEGLSLDEAFLDVSGSLRLFGDGVTIGHEVRRRVAKTTQLTCSVGVAPNKFLAKLASVVAKPRASREGVVAGHGVYEVVPTHELEFLHPLAVDALWGVGPVTFEKLNGLGIKTVGDLANFDLAVLIAVLGDSLGRHLSELAKGNDDRDVESDRDAKSIGHEETFSSDITEYQIAHDHLVRLADSVATRCRQSGVGARTISLKIKYANFQLVTRSVSVEMPVSSSQAMVRLLEPLLLGIDLSTGVRLLGISTRNLVAPDQQMSLFDSSSSDLSANNLDAAWSTTTSAIDEIRDRFGESAIKPASTIGQERDPSSSKWGPSDPKSK